MASVDINQLFKEVDSKTVCIKAGTTITHSELISQVQALAVLLQQRSEGNWILACADTYHFLCGFLALLAAGKEILLPANNQSGTVNETIMHAEGLLTDLNIETTLPKIAIDQVRLKNTTSFDVTIDIASTYLQLCTSGSTGEPKQIRKSLDTLVQETACLEQLWGHTVAQCIFASTVTHQHIYGLLFRVLWPLLTGRVFICENVEYPEQLGSLATRYDGIVLISSPAYLKRMIDVFEEDQIIDKLKIIFSSGGPLMQATSVAYTQKLHVTPIEVLGSTETGGIAHRQQQPNATVAWRKLPPVQIRRDQGSGALEVCSPFCYTSEWFRMGDAVELLDSDYFYLLGRIDRIVKIEEKRVSLPAMEKQLCECALVEDVRIVALEGYRTVLGAVCVLTASGRSYLNEKSTRLLADELKSYLANYFDRVVLPRKWRYVTEFPYNTQGKVTQDALRQLFSEQQHD